MVRITGPNSPDQQVATDAGPVPAERSETVWAKMGLLLAFLLAVVLVFRYTDAGRFLTKDAVRGFVLSFGLLGPLAHVLLYAAAVTAFIPATLMTAAGAVAFGKVAGTALNLAGATLGAALSFLVARSLGREFVARLLRGRLQDLDAAAERNGFPLMFYLRLVYFPFAPLNYGAGLSRIRFRDFFWGTALGIIPGTLIFTIFLDEVTEIRDLHDLLSVRFLVPLALFILSLFLPRLIRRLAGGRFAWGAREAP